MIKIIRIALAAPIPCIWYIKPSASVTNGWKEFESRNDNILLFPVIWSEAPESITHVWEKESKISCGVTSLGQSTCREDGIRAIWNCWNIWNYSHCSNIWNCWNNWNCGVYISLSVILVESLKVILPRDIKYLSKWSSLGI